MSNLSGWTGSSLTVFYFVYDYYRNNLSFMIVCHAGACGESGILLTSLLSPNCLRVAGMPSTLPDMQYRTL